ncbi:hypothetical protein [Bacillus andreraoultii]|uniref:hypothetical protein n=1 Tax=Bacillus andreraoultii TaxID=1499685 RepID=UPI0005A9D20D|nr:hypothetical protein [Bacillus andreraoultii]
MAIKVKVPLNSFNGYRGGVKFRNGIGVFEDEEHGRFIAESLGYEIIEDEPKKKSTKKEDKDEDKETEAKRKTTTRRRRTTTKKDNE